jgi:signal transduction histidine kinase
MARILVVDDDASIRETVQSLLADAGYDVVTAHDAESAVAKVSANPFDVVVADISLPGQNGLELLRTIHALAPHIQVIMVTGNPSVESASETVREGAADYLCKPINANAVLRSVASALKVKTLDDERRRLEEDNRRYVAQLEEQNKELQEAARFREEVERITRHDLKSPLSVMLMMPDVILSVGGMVQDQSTRLRIIQDAGRRMLNMINLSLDIFRMEHGLYELQPQPVDVLGAVREVLAHQAPFASVQNVQCVVTLDGAEPQATDQFVIAGERLLFYSMFSNLVKNALEASPPGGAVEVRLARSSGAKTIHIRNRGAVPDEIRDRFFHKYASAGKKHGTGLGAYSAKLMAKALGGSIQLDASEEGATTIAMAFPDRQLPPV